MKSDLLISIDDTDVVGGEGTGRLARRIAETLNLDVLGITRHQLFIHPSIRYTKRNSCNVIMARSTESIVSDVFEAVKDIIVDSFQEGSDPGLAIVEEAPESVVEFGLKAQGMVLRKNDALKVAEEGRVRLEEIGGNGEGVIGALAGLGLCSSGSDGRYILLKGLRELKGTVSVARLRGMGIKTVLLDDGRKLTEGSVAMANKIRPSRIDGKPILSVIEGESAYYPVIL
ncbi:MAG: ABC transporter substrate-binding protein [Thermoplasmata archaeon]